MLKQILELPQKQAFNSQQNNIFCYSLHILHRNQ